MAHTPPSPDNVRLTITVSSQVHATFKRMAEASGMSISRAMGEWLGDTLDGADAMAGMMERARKAPKLAAREIHSYALGLTDLTTELLEKVGQRPQGRETGPGRGTPPASGGAEVEAPRPVIRGVKSHQGKVGPRGGKS